MSAISEDGSCLNVLDLFSGIGGFSLGLERTGGFKTVAFCEIEAYPQKVLKKHWPDVPVYEDVRNVTREQLDSDGIGRIDVITGGFPCQDISVAGKQAGIEAERSGLWSECARLLGEIRPSYAIFENVTALISGGDTERYTNDRCLCGWPYRWRGVFGDSAQQEIKHVHAPYRYWDDNKGERYSGQTCKPGWRESQRWKKSNGQMGGNCNMGNDRPGLQIFSGLDLPASGIKDKASRILNGIIADARGHGKTPEWNSEMDTGKQGSWNDDKAGGYEAECERASNRRNRPHCQNCGREVIHESSRLRESKWFERVLWDISQVGYDAEWHCIPASELGAHHHRDRIWIICYPKHDGWHETKKQGSTGKGKEESWLREPERPDGASRDVLANTDSERLQRREKYGIFGEGGERWQELIAGQFCGFEDISQIEPTVCRGVNGIPRIVDRLKGLGNAVVPQIPELIGRAILEANAQID